MKLPLLLLLPLLYSCSSVTEKAKGPPDHKYDYYSGGDDYGNHYCKIQEFTHEKTGKTVTLIAMIHTADDIFYRQVDKELDKADIILTEGIYGLPSFGPHKYFSMYTFSIIERFMYLQGLMPQGQTLKDRDNHDSADMSSDEFASQGSFYTPILQLLSLPVMILFTEPYYLYETTAKTAAGAVSDDLRKRKEAYLRHLTLKNLDSTDAPAAALMPGIIGKRNEMLIKKLNENITKEEVKIIAIPWGASHMPPLERDLLKIGFIKKGKSKWLRTIAVKDYIETDEHFSQSSFSWGIPYLYTVKTSRETSEFNLIFSLIKNYESGNYNRFSLIYGDLFDSVSYEKGFYTSLLPRIAGKPLLFDYTSKKGKSRLRLFWFLEFGSLE